MTSLSEAQMRQLTAPLNANRVANRKQGGSTLSYLEAWDVRATLIRIFGFGGWSADLVEPVRIIDIREVKRAKETASGQTHNFVVTALATVRLTVAQLECTYTESAAASQTGPDIGEVTDFATKTAESDAMKRAAVNLGTQFGLSLYNNGDTADVIRVVLEPGQSALLASIAEARKQQRQQPQVDTQTGEVTEPDSAQVERAGASVRGAFGA